MSAGGGQNEDVPDTGTDENVVAFANRTDDDAVLEKLDSEENGEKEDTEGKDTEGKDAGENSKDKSEGEEGLEKAESGSGEQGDSGKDGNSAENGDSQDENVNPGNGESDGKGEDPDSGENGSDEKGENSDSGRKESDEKDDSGKTDSGSSGGNADLNEDGSSSNGKTDQPKEDVKTDEKTEEEIDEKEGFWRKVKVRWVLDAEESQASRYDGENPGIYLFRAELKSSNYEVDEDELPVIQITVLEEEQAKTTLEFAPLEESIADQILTLGSKESDIQFPETLTVRETMGEETTERTLSGITWKLDAENSDYSEFQGGLAPEDYFDRFDEDGEPEETEEKTWEGYDKANEEYNGAIYTYIPVIPESEEIPEDTALPEIHVQVGDAGIALYSGRIEGKGTEENPWQIKNEEDWETITTSRPYCNSGNLQGCIRLEGKIDFSKINEESRKKSLKLNDKIFDGNGYPIENLTKPLFSVANGTVKNLVLPDVKLDGNENQGAIAQTVGGKATIEQCYISGSITATGINYSGAGGLIGAVQTTSGAPLTIENCVVNANITGKGSSLAGGLIGSVSKSDVVTIEKCIAMGTISSENDSKGTGGLVGGQNRKVTIKNSAALQEEISTNKSKYYVDRIFGYGGNGNDNVYVNGGQNFAYQDMRVKCGETLLDKENDKDIDWSELHRGKSVSKTTLLTTNFWKNTIGWGSAAGNWEFAANQLPTLKMQRDNDEVTIFSGADIPEYLEATETKTGSVKSGETGIAGAEITFKKGSSEKKATTGSDGTFSIDLANGDYDVTIKKTGYITVRTTVTISDADLEALNFTMETNPVSMLSGQIVTGTFQTTDADTVTADGEIKLTYAGTDNLQPGDFKLSSEEDGTAYDGVTLLAVNTENGTGSIKIQFAKSLNLGNTNEITLYVHYKGSSIGSIVLKKKVNRVQLEAPAEVKWDETVKGKAVWSPVANASGYKVQLYKDDSALGDLVTLGADAVGYDFTAQIAESGTYWFVVRATGNASTYGDSEEAMSGTYEFSEQTLEDVKKAAQAALQAMTVTNETTAEEIFQVVQKVITNKKIHADWSDENGFKLTPATDGKDPGHNGSITGTIVLSNTSEGASTETIEINLLIAAKYAITFASGRQDSQGTAPTLGNAAAETVIRLPENTFKVYGMNFKGWSDGTNTYASGAGYTMPERNVAFEAVWVQDQWDGITAVEPTKDEHGYYQISTGAELAYFRDTNISNWKAKLMCDIDMGGHDFASIRNAGAEFDGCGHTIRGLNVVGNVYVGLFQAISSNCEIKNLTIENAEIKASRDEARVGILVGDVRGSLTVENCYVSGTIETADGTNKIESAGGLIGNVMKNYSVKIQSCYADAKIKGTTDRGFAGGLVGLSVGTTTIDNSYAVVDMDLDKGYYIGGLVGSGNVTISNSYAAGEALTKNPIGASVAGISANGSISSCVSIFPEMRSLNRIGGTTGSCRDNYGFAGTVARKSDGTILTPDPDTMGADKLYGADATAANLKDPEFYKGLGWDFDSIWMMDSTGGYAFPILKNQTLSPDLTLDLTPSVTGITLDKTNETIYPRGSVQLTATVDVANGASREVTWKSSDPAVKVEDGLVIAADVANGTYIITAISKADPSKQAECQLTVDTAEHTVTVGRENTINSLNAVVKAYASLDDAKKETNPISTIGSETGTFTFSRKAGEKVYLAFTGLDPKDVVSEVTITGENNSKVNATICNLENPTVYCFTMPCSNASVQVSYAEDITAYQYTWFVGQEWGTWGTTAAFETKEWSGGDHIGSLEVTKIINGKLFKEFNIKSMSLYKKGSVTPNKVNSRAELKKNGDYYIEKDNTTGLPTLYVYLDGPGMVAVDIEVQDDLNAVFSITQKLESSSYYTLDKITAKAGELVTATLTDAGVEQMKEMQNKNACLTYSGGLLIVVYPPKFTESGGKWTASFKMPAQNIETHVYFGDKDKVTLNGTDKEVDYDGTPKSVGDEIQATIGGQDLSEQFQGQYEVYYKGVNGTVYSSTTPPTNAGTYSCKIKIPDSTVSYMSDPITVRLTIKKIATKTPKAPQAAAWTDTSVTLEAPSAFVDGTAIPAGYELEYCVDQGEWQDSPVFTGLTPETTYNFYVRLKEGVNTTASAASEAVTVQTKKASSDPSNPTKPNPSNPNPSTPGNPQGTTTSGRDRSTSTWVKESTGWRYRLSNGTYLSGSLVLDPATGRQVEQVVWKQLRGAWWAFGADGYIRTGWVYDYSAGEWYYVDENTGMRTGWYLDPQDGRWYYLDPVTGEMLTEWQLIPDLGYVYLNPYAPQPTWAYDEALKTWVYMEGAGRPYGSLYMAEWTPDGYYANADGVWEPAR